MSNTYQRLKQARQVNWSTVSIGRLAGFHERDYNTELSASYSLSFICECELKLVTYDLDYQKNLKG